MVESSGERIIRVGVIGTGYGARVHVPVLQKMSGVKVVGLVGKQHEKTCAIAKEAGIPWSPASAKDLIQSSDVDAITMAVPPTEQPDLAVFAFENGKHVLCEKPLAVTPEGARRIADAWKRSGRIGMVDFCYRLVPEFVQFKTLLAQGVCGRIHSILAEWILSNRLNQSLTFHWKGQEELGGGVLQNFGVHVLDYLFHDSKAVNLLGAKRDVFVPQRNDDQGKVHRSTGDEVATGLYESDGGVAVMVHLSLVSAPPLGHRVTARGSKATLEISNLNPESPAGPFSLWLYDNSGNRHCLSLAEDWKTSGMTDLFSRVATQFIQAIHGNNGEAEPSIACGVRACELVNAFSHCSQLHS